MKKNIAIIAAMCEKSKGIGFKNSLPWPKEYSDLHHFKRTTSGGTGVMGYNTYESIGRALPNRENFVLTSKKFMFPPPGIKILNSVDKVLELDRETLWIIGGQSLYEQFLPVADQQVLTYVKGEWECDTFYPSFDVTEWESRSCFDLPLHKIISWERKTEKDLQSDAK